MGANPGSRYYEMAAKRACRVQESAEQQRVEQEAHAATETLRRQQQRAQFKAEMEALAAAAAQQLLRDVQLGRRQSVWSTWLLSKYINSNKHWKHNKGLKRKHNYRLLNMCIIRPCRSI